MIALSPALATLLVIAQVATSTTETCTPKACRDWRIAYYTEHGTTLKFQEETWRLGGDLADAETRVAELEARQLEPRPTADHPKAWGGWPYVATAAILAAFGFGFYLGRAP